MTDTNTARLNLPLLQAGQAQKEMSHNEALAALDLLVAPAVLAAGLDVPPAAPEAGQCWIVGSDPQGDWAGHPGALAGWTGGGWRFVAAMEGLCVWDLADGVARRWTAAGWEAGTLRGTSLVIGGLPVVGARQAAVADPAGGPVVDGEARAAVAAILAALRQHGLIAR